MVAFFMFLLIWLSPLALAGPVRQAPSSGEKSKLIFKEKYLKTDNHFILVMIIKCVTDSNIKVLYNEIVIFK